ncbi:hypothetical protein [Rummeliibacillus sp. TYF005]|uniref:hypothetical protein n=1 Tax=Rummeliibacillus sp. TYF005 TaxID=2058214 RepID=UPI000F53A5C2|nr:hypothetical protein [Rummeliibacillus sp. TYF005]RPJ97225.1 hypothetical protein CW357_00715 [Rummeliibacillus sp. TYF005]
MKYNFLHQLIEDITIIEPRKLIPYKREKGIFFDCLDKYIQNRLKDYDDKEKFQIYFSKMKVSEIRLFNEILFKLIFNPRYVYQSTLHCTLENISKQTNMGIEEIEDILSGLSLLQLEISEPTGNVFILSSLFNVSIQGKVLNGEEHNFKLNFNDEFLAACKDVGKNTY